MWVWFAHLGMQYKLCVGCLACLPFLDVTSFGMCLVFQIWLGFQRQDQNCLDAQRRTLCEVLNSLSKPWIPVISWSLLGGRQETKWPHWNRGNWGMVCAGVCKGLGNYSHSCIGRNGEQKAQLINELFFFFFFTYIGHYLLCSEKFQPLKLSPGLCCISHIRS